MTEQELRLASDNFLSRIDRLHALEELKRELPPIETAEVAREALIEERYGGWVTMRYLATLRVASRIG